jgi:hypothetical protein
LAEFSSELAGESKTLSRDCAMQPQTSQSEWKTLMKLRSIIAAALFAGVSAPAFAYDQPAGQWMDVRNHIALGALPDNSESVARLNYAKTVCHAREGTVAGGPVTAGYDSCMKAQGFVFAFDTPAQIAARRRAADNERMRAAGYAIGQALTTAGQQMQPHYCNGNVMAGGAFNMQCD